jgi:RimJ/RimL family protein N-acetyltransferase
MKGLFKKLARLIFGEYSVYYIYSGSANSGQVFSRKMTGFQFTIVKNFQVESSKDDLIAEQAWYGGYDTYAYACMQGSRIVGLCYFWHGERYRTRNFWPLAEGEAKLVQIVTIPEIRGRGVATNLIAYASIEMAKRGFHCLYARIWHSNIASVRAFKRAGWKPWAIVVEVHLPFRKPPFRVTFPIRTRCSRERASYYSAP